MNKESVERLRFDRRLQRRNGWIDPADQESYLDALPDVSAKMTTCAKEELSAGEAAAESSAPDPRETPAAPQATAAPTAGDFSTPGTFGGFRDDSGSN